MLRQQRMICQAFQGRMTSEWCSIRMMWMISQSNWAASCYMLLLLPWLAQLLLLVTSAGHAAYSPATRAYFQCLPRLLRCICKLLYCCC
jgi:hypothetical protein